jgi:hypothetical protein
MRWRQGRIKSASFMLTWRKMSRMMSCRSFLALARTLTKRFLMKLRKEE